MNHRTHRWIERKREKGKKGRGRGKFDSKMRQKKACHRVDARCRAIFLFDLFDRTKWGYWRLRHKNWRMKKSRRACKVHEFSLACEKGLMSGENKVIWTENAGCGMLMIEKRN